MDLIMNYDQGHETHIPKSECELNNKIFGAQQLEGWTKGTRKNIKPISGASSKFVSVHVNSIHCLLNKQSDETEILDCN